MKPTTRDIVMLLTVTGALLACKQLSGEKDAPEAKPAPAASASAAPQASASAKPKPPEPPPGEVVDITADAVKSIEASSEQYNHPAKNIFDNNPKTAWGEDSPSDGEGHWIEATLHPDTYVAYVEVGGGWGTETRHGEDLWELNNTFHKMRVSWDGGEEVVTFVRSQDRGKKKRVDINAKTEKLRFTAESVARGKYDDLMLDDVLIHGVMGR